MEDCIFCKIISGEIPGAKVYEDENCLAILDVNPVSRGHTLVIPKKHSATLLDTPAERVKDLFEVVQKLAPSVVEGVDGGGFNLHINTGEEAGQTIFHLHLHIIPRSSGDHLEMRKGSSYDEGEAEEVQEAILEAWNKST